MKKLFITLIVIILVGAGGTAVYLYTRQVPDPDVMTGTISRGDVIQTVSATGTLEAVQTVLVGTQVTGIVKELNSDFNRMVHKGQLLARLDRTNFEAALEQQKAALLSRNTDLDRQQVSLEDARVKLKRQQDLFARTPPLITQQDLEAAVLNVKTLEMQIESAKSAIVQQQASVNQAQINLNYTDIYSPIDGIVINRAVDVGQTVVSSQSASVIFSIAADLTAMQAKASVDESDVALIRTGQRVTFRVDAYQNREFVGSVSQVRLQPVVSQNVVTYIAIINIPNLDYSLKPGMTTNVKIEIARKENVLRIPNGAIRFRPTQDIFDALKQEMPPELKRGKGGLGGATQMAGGKGGGQSGFTGGTGRAPGGTQTADNATPGQSADQQRGKGKTGQNGRDSANRQANLQPGAPGGRGGQGGFGNMDPAERAKRLEERMKSMTPEQRKAFEDRMKNGGGRGQGQGPGFGSQNGRQGGRQQQQPQTTRAESKAATADTSQTIDALFAPLTFRTTPARAWMFVAKKLKAVSLVTGITDGSFTEIVGEPEGLPAGTAVVTAVNLPQKSSAVPAAGASPLNPQNQRGGGPGGGGGGRGGGR